MGQFQPSDAVAVLYHPAVRGAEEVAATLGRQATDRGLYACVETLPELADELPESLKDVGLFVCVGGDGTVLHASSFAARAGIPVFGVRMGRLGFLTESTQERAADDFVRVLDGNARLEERALVQARVGESGEALHALNDVVIGRATLGRTVSVVAQVDSVTLAEYRADALVISTATGSTGYALSVGGPILHPESKEMVLVPVAPHLTRANALVLPSTTTLRLTVQRSFEAMMSVDGVHHRQLESGTVVEITRSPRTVSFVRLGGEHEFYNSLASRLGWLRADHVIDEMGSHLDGASEATDG